MMKTLICLSLILLPLVSVAEELITGGWMTTTNVWDEDVVEIAKDAITEHNKQSNEYLLSERVVKAETQLVAGMNYDLIISAKNCSGATKNYRANVYDVPWENFRCHHGGLEPWNL